MTGVQVKVLDSYPELFEAESFYLGMFNQVGNDLPSIIKYCELYGMTRSETLEAVEIMIGISNEVT